MNLSSAQVKKLRAEGHRLKLKPVVTVGQKGLGESLHNEIEVALNHHELLKLRIPGADRAAKRELAEMLCQRHQASRQHPGQVELIAGTVGQLRRQRDPQDRAAGIELGGGVAR